MNDDSPIDQIHRAPNDKFYALWDGWPICRADGGLRYFETMQEARTFLAEGDAENAIGELVTVVPKLGCR